MIHGINSLPKLYRKEKTVIRKGEIVRYMTWMDQQGREYDNQYRLVEQGPKESDEFVIFIYFIVFIILILWIVDYFKKRSDGDRRSGQYGGAVGRSSSCMGSISYESYPCPYHHHVTTGHPSIAPYPLGVL
jgi:hypothetical protein